MIRLICYKKDNIARFKLLVGVNNLYHPESFLNHFQCIVLKTSNNGFFLLYCLDYMSLWTKGLIWLLPIDSQWEMHSKSKKYGTFNPRSNKKWNGLNTMASSNLYSDISEVIFCFLLPQSLKQTVLISHLVWVNNVQLYSLIRFPFPVTQGK